MRRPKRVSVRLVDAQFANIYRKGGVWPITSGSPNEVQEWLYTHDYGWSSSDEDTLSGTYEATPSIEKEGTWWSRLLDSLFDYFIEEE